MGKRMRMSLVNNKTRELWQGFMTSRKLITNSIGTDLYSMQIYDPMYFVRFSPVNEFEKWATTEVTDFETVPLGMETIVLPGGMYAVFLHKGPASEGGRTFQYIYGTWIPHSEYALDNRPHFEILGDKYKNDDPGSEEEVWIPGRLKSDT